MFNVIRSSVVRTQPPPTTALFSSPFPHQVGRKTPSGLRFQHAASDASHPPDNMDKAEKSSHNPVDDKKGDMMSHSFGEGYATRSNDDGFGGIYGGNESLDDGEKADKIIHGNSAEYDKSQGSDVKEKEKARNQTHANC